MSVRIRGIYATALTHLLGDVVQASPPIRDRFDESLTVEPAECSVETTADRQGVGCHGDVAAIEDAMSAIGDLGRDTFDWAATLPLGAIYAGEVVETPRSGAVVDCGPDRGFLPYSKTERRIEEGDTLRVQVAEPRPPWSDHRSVLDTTVRVGGPLCRLVRGGPEAAGAPELADLLPVDPPEGWAPDWGRGADDADLSALGGALERASGLAEAVDEAFFGAPDPATAAPHTYWEGRASRWVWFGRESRFALDEHRRSVTATMPGHHRIKAGAAGASTAVDFVEAVCPGAGSEWSEAGSDEGASGLGFPFAAVLEQFGPATGDRVAIRHGKPDGRCFSLGRAAVTDVDPDGTVTLSRSLSGGGTYDGLGVAKRDGDEAITKCKEGRWWYPTVYRRADGESVGTYVNVCTPVEVFPDTVRYVDLHVDVLKHADGSVAVVDDDELEAAISAGHVSAPLATKARDVARAVSNALS